MSNSIPVVMVGIPGIPGPMVQSVPTPAAVNILSTATFLPGTQINVASIPGSLFRWMPTYAGKVDNVLAIAASSTGAWVRVDVVGAVNTALTQTTWFVDRVNGLATNSGLTGFPVDSLATIINLWTGGIPGTRVRLPNATITITISVPAAVQPDIADPISAMMDLDIVGGPTILIQSGVLTVARSGTLASASAFARTSAAGQISVTDAGVADFSLYACKSTTVGGLFHDITTGAVSWLYEPQTANATGKVDPGRTALTAGVQATPTPVAINTGDLYEVLTPVQVYFGAQCTVRNTQSSSSPSFSGARFVLYRLWGRSAGAGDCWRPGTGGDVATSLGPNIEVQECRIDQRYVVDRGVVRFVNCAMTASSINGVVGAGNLVILAGFTYGFVNAFYGGDLRVDCDFVIDGTGTISGTGAGAIFIGNMSRWAATGPAFGIEASAFHFQNVFEGQHVVYGTVGAANLVIKFTSHSNSGGVTYAGAGSAVATFQFDSNVTNFQFPVSLNSGFGVDPATGLSVGPTTNTWAHLDAALGAGTGFGGAARDPTTGDVLRVG